MEKDVFVLSQVWEKEKILSPLWVIKTQTFEFKAQLIVCKPSDKLIPVSMAWSDQKYNYSSLDGMPFNLKVTPSAFHQASLTICQYPFILLGGEWHCFRKVYCTRTQHIDLVRSWTQTSQPGVQCTDHQATTTPKGHRLVLRNDAYFLFNICTIASSQSRQADERKGGAY